MKTLSALIQKYNQNGPRYTSYPPVPFWKNPPSEDEWLTHILDRYDPAVGIDLYVHVPFCESLCFYCGCHRTITRDHSVERPFVEMLLKEFRLYEEKLGLAPTVNSLHFGGGTPTFLSAAHLDLVLSELLKNRRSYTIVSIEIDPRTCTSEQLAVLRRHGVNRISLGIQDFDPEVQKAINRKQSPEMIAALVKELREMGFESLNFDLIYGLPDQTSTSLLSTIEIVKKMAPDLIALYSYAHLPEKLKNQRAIKESQLPDPVSKRELYELAKVELVAAGYLEIGMDHFGRKDSYLAKAMAEKNLHRNFMGFVDKKSEVLIGLGPSSISDSSRSFIQNAREMKIYSKLLAENKLPFEKGHVQTETELIIEQMILNLLCELETKIHSRHPHLVLLKDDLSMFEEDGLIEILEDQVKVTELGRTFVRNIAMSFDPLLREKSTIKFSTTI